MPHKPKLGRPPGTLRGRTVKSYTYALEPATHAEVLQRCKDESKRTGKKYTRGQLVAAMLNATRK